MSEANTQINPETMREMLKAANSMGAAKSNERFNSQPISFSVVDAFSTHFGQWAVQGSLITAQLFPRVNAADIYYKARYTNEGKTYIPGRLEAKPKGLHFPEGMEDIVKEACNKVTFGDVELDFVKELGAWAIRFRDCTPLEDWMKDGGLLEQFFTEIDKLLEQR